MSTGKPSSGISRLRDILRSGAWLDADRVRVHARSVAVLACIALTLLISSASGGVDPFGSPLGTDFASFYSAGLLAADGHPLDAYDWNALHAIERSLFGDRTPLFIWTYPPFALLPMSALSRLPYGWALSLFVLATSLACGLLLRRIAGRVTGAGTAANWAILGFPALWLNAAHGQNGCLSTVLLGLGLSLLPTRPALAGIALGLLSYKPQLMLLVPVALILGGHHGALRWAIATAAAAIALSLIRYGPEPWMAFLDGMGQSRAAILDAGATGFHKLQSVLGAARLLGASPRTAWAMQALAGIAALAAVIRAWRGPVPLPTRRATLVCAALVATPFLNVYDLVLLALPIAWLSTAPGRRPDWEISLLCAAWLLPLCSVPLAATFGIPLTPVLTITLLAHCWRRAGLKESCG